MLLKLNGYYSLSCVAELLDLAIERVLELINFGPLIARIQCDGALMVHEDDLAEFRRPALVNSQCPIISGSSTAGGGLFRGSERFGGAQHLATGQAREVAERWAPVVGSDRHEVSTLGRLRTWKLAKRKARLTVPLEVRPRNYAEGYLGFAKQSALHVAVLEAFVGPCPEGHEAAHKNGDKHDNRLENLRWATHAENIAEKTRHGTCSSRTRANLTDEESAEIVRRRDAGESRSRVAADFGVVPQTVSLHTRRHLTLVAQP